MKQGSEGAREREKRESEKARERERALYQKSNSAMLLHSHVKHGVR